MTCHIHGLLDMQSSQKFPVKSHMIESITCAHTHTERHTSSSITTIVMLSSIFFQSSRWVLVSFCSFTFFGSLSAAITITAVNKTKNHEFFTQSAFSWASWHFRGKDKRDRCGDGDDTKQFSRICIRNWIKMQSYYSPFAIKVNERYMMRVGMGREGCVEVNLQENWEHFYRIFFMRNWHTRRLNIFLRRVFFFTTTLLPSHFSQVLFSFKWKELKFVYLYPWGISQECPTFEQEDNCDSHVFWTLLELRPIYLWLIFFSSFLKLFDSSFVIQVISFLFSFRWPHFFCSIRKRLKKQQAF